MEPGHRAADGEFFKRKTLKFNGYGSEVEKRTREWICSATGSPWRCPSRFAPGDTVQTPFGKGRRGRCGTWRLMVDVQGRAMVVKETEISVLDAVRQSSRARPVASERASGRIRPQQRRSRQAPAEVDLHGLTVEEALDRAQDALNEALLADFGELRFIHGRGGGRIRAALHRRLRETPSVRGFRLDPRNEGVTIVRL